MFAQRAVDLQIVAGNAMRRGEQLRGAVGTAHVPACAQRRALLPQRPGQIHRGRAANRQQGKCGGQFPVKLITGSLTQLLRFKRNAVGGGAADGRGATHDQRTDGHGGCRRSVAAQVFAALGQPALIEQFQFIFNPAQCMKCGHYGSIERLC